MTASSEESSRKGAMPIPSEHDLRNYVKAYMGAYMGVVEKEHPDSLPSLAKNAPYDIEVCILPNGCFCIMFQKSTRENIIVSDRGWEYVEGKATSGIDHLVTVYTHEGVSVADAIKRGKKDALNDIRSMESNEIVQASLHLEKIVDELTNVAMSNRASLKSVASQISKLAPIKESAKRGLPHSDMLRMVQGLRDYPAAPIEVKLELPDRELLQRVSAQLANASELVSRIEAQDELIVDIEERIKKAYDQLTEKVDEKIDHSLALLLTASDRKIDKGLAAAAEVAKGGGVPDERLRQLEERLDELSAAVSKAGASRSQSLMSERLQEALSEELTESKEKLGELTMRVEVIEEYLMKISGIIKRRA